LLVQADGKVDALFLRSLAELHAAGGAVCAREALANLPIAATSHQPAHGAELIAVTTLGLEARRETRGHRFEAQMDPVVLRDADHYARQLEEQGAVIASFEHRRAEVTRQLRHTGASARAEPIDDEALLDEVTALVERPNVLLCRFEPEFLAVPPECLILTMKANQKYFPLLDAQGRLTNQFLVVSNIRPADAGAVILGNQRVVRPRLADAKFFFDQDRLHRLESRVQGLSKVIYHKQARHAAERRACERSRAIGDERAAPRSWRESTAPRCWPTDLLTDMVGEPELQA
jgi:glycyl-tRNA synthetase beta chain